VTVPGARTWIPPDADIPALAQAALGCQGCELFGPATQTVFGEGNVDADVVFVGEQPGDVEDRRGRPFVGPAGVLFDRALADAGIERAGVYITNAVKHFRFEPSERGQRRIHKTPEAAHVNACRPWLAAELNRIRPRVVVILGATAAKALLPPAYRVTRDRGQVMDGPPGSGARFVGTVHPSSVLRTPDAARDGAFAALVADLKVAAALLA
jgi:uracil-DNA glycosylase family protein